MPPRLRTELIDGDRLHVAPVREREHQLLVLDEVEVGEVARIGRDRRAAFVAVLVLDRGELFFDHRAQLHLVGEDRFELGDGLCELVVLVAQLLALQRGEAAQRHVEDVGRLRLAEVVRRELQCLARRVGRLRSTDQRDDRVDHVERLEQTLEDVRPVAGLVQPVLTAPGDDLDLVPDVFLEGHAQIEQARHAVDERHHVRREVALHRRVFVELVEHDLRVRVALEVDDEPDRVAGREVFHVADALDAVIVDQLLDLRRDHFHRRLVRQLRHEDPLPTVALFFDLGGGAHADRAPARAVVLGDAGPAEDRGAGREIGSRNELHEVFDGRFGIVDQVERGVDHLAQVVGRDVRRHADRDTAAAVHEQVREPGGHDERLAVAAVVRVAEIDGVLVDLAQQLHRERRQPRLGVTRRGRPVVR